jgi:streptogramin lyase
MKHRPRALPESAVMRQCADYAVMRGALVIRVNAGAMPTPDGRWFRASRWRAPGHLWHETGVSDLVVIWRGRVFVVETKAGDNTISPTQDEFLEAADEAGAVVVVAYSVDDLRSAMEEIC